jgi:hypothetical protein
MIALGRKLFGQQRQHLEGVITDRLRNTGQGWRVSGQKQAVAVAIPADARTGNGINQLHTRQQSQMRRLQAHRPVASITKDPRSQLLTDQPPGLAWAGGPGTHEPGLLVLVIAQLPDSPDPKIKHVKDCLGIGLKNRDSIIDTDQAVGELVEPDQP